MRGKCEIITPICSVPKYQRLSLGKQIQNQIYNGVDTSVSGLLKGIYDASAGDIDNGVKFSYRDENGHLVADKFDRAVSNSSPSLSRVPIPSSEPQVIPPTSTEPSTPVE